MADFGEYLKRFFEDNASQRPNPQPSKDKYVVVKQNGRQKIYRVNKYGELFEQKQ